MRELMLVGLALMVGGSLGMLAMGLLIARRDAEMWRERLKEEQDALG